VVDKDPELKASAQKAVVLLMRAYGRMMLQDGLFHADPHPGNMLLQV
jgi:predicted unusual protein kinase regulating ubiquinone biosynthesis (AarF/ABC1/UbiB family)